MSIISEHLPDSKSKIHETSVDFIIRKCPKEVHIVQYDKTQPVVAVQLYSNGIKYVLPTSAVVNLRFSKPDNTFVYKPVLGCDSTRTIVYFDVNEQMTLLYGKVNPILELVLGDTIAGSSMIPFEIDRNPIQNGDIESAIEVPAIMEDIGKANETANKANETANKALEVANEAKKITDNVATKDDVANSASDTLAAAKEYTDGKISGIDFSSYVTNDGLTTILGDYVTKSLLNSTLSSYVTSTALSTTLKSYSKTTEIDSKDAATLKSAKDYTDSEIAKIDTTSYVTNDSLTTILDDYITKNNLSALLGNYVTKSLLNSTLSSYVTSTALSTTLKSYSKTTEIDSKDAATLKSAKDYTDSEIAKIDLSSYVTNDNLTTILGDYVTKAGNEMISGAKTFTNRIISNFIPTNKAEPNVQLNEVGIFTIGNYTKDDSTDYLMLDKSGLTINSHANFKTTLGYLEFKITDGIHTARYSQSGIIHNGNSIEFPDNPGRQYFVTTPVAGLNMIPDGGTDRQALMWADGNFVWDNVGDALTTGNNAFSGQNIFSADSLVEINGEFHIYGEKFPAFPTPAKGSYLMYYDQYGPIWIEDTQYAKTTYVNAQDEATLSSAKSYVDDKISKIDYTNYVKLNDNNTFTKNNIFNNDILVGIQNGKGTYYQSNGSVQVVDENGDSQGTSYFPSSEDDGFFYLAYVTDDTIDRNLGNYATKAYTDEKISGIDLTPYVTKTSLDTTLSGYAKLSGTNKFAGNNEFSNRIQVGSWLYNIGSVGSVEYGNMIQFPSKSGWFAYASDEDSANLSLYARYTDLDSYVAKTSLASTLDSYVTKISLDSTLAGYLKLSGGQMNDGASVIMEETDDAGVHYLDIVDSRGVITYKKAPEDTDNYIAAVRPTGFKISSPSGSSPEVTTYRNGYIETNDPKGTTKLYFPTSVQGYFAWSANELDSDLALYLKTATFNTTISSYVKQDSLTTTLKDYLTISDFNGAIVNYAKLVDVSSEATLRENGDKETLTSAKSYTDGELSKYTTKSSLETTLTSYVKKSGDTVTGQLLFTSSDSTSKTGLLDYGLISFSNTEDTSESYMDCWGFVARAADGNGEFIYLNKSGIDYSENDGASPRTRSIFPFTGKHAKVYLAYSTSKAGAFLDEALASYITSSTLSDTLKNYVTSSELSTTLQSYATTKDLGNYIPLDGNANIGGVKTFLAPAKASGEQHTTIFDTSNGGALYIGKEGPNSGTMLRFDQVKGTPRLFLRASATAGVMVWSQPEKGAVLYFDLTDSTGTTQRTFLSPKTGGLLASPKGTYSDVTASKVAVTSVSIPNVSATTATASKATFKGIKTIGNANVGEEVSVGTSLTGTKTFVTGVTLGSLTSNTTSTGGLGYLKDITFSPASATSTDTVAKAISGGSFSQSYNSTSKKLVISFTPAAVTSTSKAVTAISGGSVAKSNAYLHYESAKQSGTGTVGLATSKIAPAKASESSIGDWSFADVETSKVTLGTAISASKVVATNVTASKIS